MSLSTYVAGVLAAVALGLGGWGWANHLSASKSAAEVVRLSSVVQLQTEALEAAGKAAARLSKVNQGHASKIAALTAKQKAQTDAKTKALAAAPDWAAAPVPDSVAEWVRNRASGSNQASPRPTTSVPTAGL